MLLSRSWHVAQSIHCKKVATTRLHNGYLARAKLFPHAGKAQKAGVCQEVKAEMVYYIVTSIPVDCLMPSRVSPFGPLTVAIQLGMDSDLVRM